MYLEEDYLNRNEDVDNIKNIINNMLSIKEYKSFAINGSWGTGKTFLINMLKESLDPNYLFIVYDTWQNNYFDEPLIGLLDCLMKKLDNEILLKELIKEGLKHVLIDCLNILDSLLYHSVKIKPFSCIRDIINIKGKKKESRYSFNTSSKIQNAKEITKNALARISKVKPVIIVIDELDRCSPTYALKTLERVHHIREDSASIISIYCVDKMQLENIVNSLYCTNDDTQKGEKKSADGYLRKIIDFKYELDCGRINRNDKIIPEDLLSLFNEKFSNPCLEESDLYELISDIVKDVGVRTYKKIIESCHLLHHMAFADKKYDKDVLALEIFYVYSEIIGIQKRNDLINLYLRDKIVGNDRISVNVDNIKTLIGFLDTRMIKQRALLLIASWRNVSSMPSYSNDFFNLFYPLIRKIKV